MTPALLADHETLPTIRTPRLALRWLTADDVPALFAIFSDPEVTRYWSSPALRDRAEADVLLAQIHRHFRYRTLFQWGIARQSDDLVIGTCTLAHLDATHRRAEVGFALGRAHWRQGYVGETLVAALRFAFEELGLNRIEADVDPRNERSIRSLERLGFRREGYQRQRYIVNGEVQDSVLFGLLREEWDRHGERGV
ncbi:MAG TPA: GNAT family protein [Gemmatimonadaceae bacterium]|nr:GNAT family protein [Gemmatimonadaceae bacterium]